MPSLTQWVTYSLANLGPMTTTFTAAPSCATPAAPLIAIADDAFSTLLDSDCDYESRELFGEGCWPSARAANSLETAVTEAATEGTTVTQPDRLLAYFSPGLECPFGWTTAGTIAKPTATAEEAGRTTEPARLPDASGVYAGRNYSMVNEHGEYWHPDQALAHALVPGETLAMCCPSGYQGDEAGLCRSSVGIATEMGFSTVCWKQGSGPYPVVWTTVQVNITDQFYHDQTATALSIVWGVTLIQGGSESVGALPAATSPATGASAGGPGPTETPATGVSAGGPGPTETPSTGARKVLGNAVPLLLIGGLVAGMAGSGLVS